MMHKFIVFFMNIQVLSYMQGKTPGQEVVQTEIKINLITKTVYCVLFSIFYDTEILS